MGDDEEHAILLCNYFNYIDRAEGRQVINQNDMTNKNYVSYLVYGEAVPRGATFFVARRDCKENCVELWDPVNGSCYFISKAAQGGFGPPSGSSDTLLPLKKVWAVIGAENAWANIQENASPQLIDWDLK